MTFHSKPQTSTSRWCEMKVCVYKKLFWIWLSLNISVWFNIDAVRGNWMKWKSHLSFPDATISITTRWRSAVVLAERATRSSSCSCTGECSPAALTHTDSSSLRRRFLIFARLEKQFDTTWLTLSARQPTNNSRSWINTHMYCSNYVYHISWQTFHFPDLVRSQGWSGRLGGLLSVWRQGDWVRRRFRQRSLHPAVQMPHYR